MTSTTIGTQNTRYGKAKLPNFAAIVCRQEMTTAKSHRVLQSKKRYWTVPKAHGVPSPRAYLTISGRKSACELIKSGWIRVHSGEEQETPTRGILWALMKVRKRRLIVINPWPINGGWKPQKFGEEAKWRELLWGAYIEDLRRLIKDLRQEYPDAEVVVAGDFNWPKPISLPGMRMVARNGVDQIYISSGLRKTRLWRLPRWGSDHRPLKVRLVWK